MEHGRVRGVGIHPVRLARHDDLQRRLVHPRIAHLHRAGVRAQHQRLGRGIGLAAGRPLDVESVGHRPRRVIGRDVERREVEVVFLDLGTIRHVEADGAEDLLDPLDGERDRMQATRGRPPAGQRHVQPLRSQPLGQPFGTDCLDAGVELRLDALLDLVERLATLGLLGPGQRSQSLEQRGQCTTLAQEGRLGICQPGLVGHGVKTGAGLFDQLLQIIHHCLRFLSRNMCRTAIGDRPKANGDRYSGTGSVRLSIPVGDPARCRIPLVFRPQDIRQCRSTAVPQAAAVPSVDLTCSTMALKAGLSLTASSARTLRSSAISAFSRPFMNTL